jgi:hypothetical protein
MSNPLEKQIIECPNCQKQMRIPIGKHITFTCPNCNSPLEFNDKPIQHNSEIEESKNPKKDENWWLEGAILQFVTILLALPIFMAIHRLLPNPNWIFNLDQIIILVLIITIVRYAINKQKSFIFGAFFMCLLLLLIGSLTNIYGFKDIIFDYKTYLYSLKSGKVSIPLLGNNLRSFKNKSTIEKAIDFENKDVRNFAVAQTLMFRETVKRTSKYRTLIQSFAIFKTINSQWNYVHDPKSREYYAKASEFVKHFSGDCDDHSILMAAAIKSIGGTVRLVRTNRHLYPEIYIGNSSDFEVINYLIRVELFPFESQGKKLHYHIDENKNIWLNLDYTEKYPGGEFMSEEIFGILNV